MNETRFADQTATVRARGGFYAIALLLAGVIGIGVYALLVQLREGLGVTGLNSYVTWGMYIVNFEFFVGLSTGAALLASLVYGFRADRYRPVARIAIMLAFVSLLLAGVSILVSMGRPTRAVTLLFYGRLTSPLLWDVIMLSTSLLLFAAMLYLEMRADFARGAAARPRMAWLLKTLALGRTDVSPAAIAKDKSLLRALAIFAIPWAILLHSVTAWIFGLVKARPAWHSTLLAPLYVVSALVSGIALVIVVTLLAKWFFKTHIPPQVLGRLSKVLLISMPILGYFLFAELLTTTFGGGVPDEQVFFDDMLWGQYAWVFWFDLLGGILLPLAIVAVPKWRRSEVMVFTAALLVVIGVYAERFNLVVVPQFHKLLPHVHGSYTPTWVEIAVTSMLVAALGLAVMLFSRLVPLAEEDEMGAPTGR